MARAMTDDEIKFINRHTQLCARYNGLASVWGRFLEHAIKCCQELELPGIETLARDGEALQFELFGRTFFLVFRFGIEHGLAEFWELPTDPAGKRSATKILSVSFDEHGRLLGQSGNQTEADISLPSGAFFLLRFVINSICRPEFWNASQPV